MFWCNHPKIWTKWFNHSEIHQENADGMAESVHPDQPDPRGEQSDLGLHCLPRPVCQKTHYGELPFYH